MTIHAIALLVGDHDHLASHRISRLRESSGIAVTRVRLGEQVGWLGDVWLAIGVLIGSL
jgi:hypothetical protein